MVGNGLHRTDNGFCSFRFFLCFFVFSFVFFWFSLFFFFFFFFLMIRRPPRSTLFPLHDALPILKDKVMYAACWQKIPVLPRLILRCCARIRGLAMEWNSHRSCSIQREISTCGAIGSTRLVSLDRKSTRLNSSHSSISYAVFCLKK